MKINTITTSIFTQPTLAIVLFAFEKERLSGPAGLQALLRRVTDKEFKGASKQLLLLHTDGKLPAARILLVGLGTRRKFSAETLRRAMGLATKKLRRAGIDRAAVQVRADLEGCPELDVARILTEAAMLASYEFTQFKAPDGSATELKSLTFCAPANADVRAAVQIIARTRTIIDATNYAREIGNLPGNVVFPSVIADYARKLAKENGLKCTVLNKTALEKHRFGGLLAVGSGSSHEPQLIVLEYYGNPTRSARPVALVGKALTFDSGGISIKPGDKMDEMKFDKCGGLAVLGTLKAAAQLKLPINILGIIAAAENLPSATSYRPGDIVTSYKGKGKRGITIEVLNTDAEGRIVLGDALAYACERDAVAIVDIATLTGACVVALGTFIAGLLGNDEQLQERIRAAADRTGERVWPLPLADDYREKIKSDVADIKNTGGREGGTITAAAFLEKYVGNTPWAHIDIAGTAWTTEQRPYYAKGATGFGVRLLVDTLSHWGAQE
ncbi:MAG: leucyl aminopeptidase [Verrucomicrobiia bacterium]